MHPLSGLPSHPQPKNFLDYISTYRRSLGARRQQVADQTARLEGGLSKLIQAASEVRMTTLRGFAGLCACGQRC